MIILGYGKGMWEMLISKDIFIEQFSQLALDERISLFLGAGGSCDAGYPSWSNLFEPMAKSLKIDINNFTDYYKLAQFYCNEFGTPELRKRINDTLKSNEFKSPLMDELINIGFTNIWTTNFDNVIELNYQARNILTNKIFRDKDLVNIDLNKQINIFKMNGDISNLDDIIATRSDYERYADFHKLMLLFFKRELVTSTFLFIGYSFTDNLALDCLGELARYLKDSTNYHYTIIKKEPNDPYFKHFITDLEKRYYIRVLLVDSHNEIPEILFRINEKIRSKRVFISGAFNSQNLKIEQYSHDLCKKLSNALYSSDYRIVNGIGRRFGTHLIGYANENLAKRGIKNFEKYIIIRPFVGIEENANEEKKRLRKEVIDTCGAAIFIFGETNNIDDAHRSGVYDEFRIACELHKIVIPIAYEGMISQEIWNKIKDDLTCYPYLESSIDKLTSNTNIDELVTTIIYILDSIKIAL